MQQYGSKKTADQSHDRDRRRSVQQRQARSFGNQDRHVNERGSLRRQLIERERRVWREIKQNDAAGGENLREDAPLSFVIAVSKRGQRYAGGDSDRDTTQLANPAIVECVFQKKCSSKKY